VRRASEGGCRRNRSPIGMMACGWIGFLSGGIERVVKRDHVGWWFSEYCGLASIPDESPKRSQAIIDLTGGSYGPYSAGTIQYFTIVRAVRS